MKARFFRRRMECPYIHTENRISHVSEDRKETVRPYDKINRDIRVTLFEMSEENLDMI